jgi:hypothetical protein
MFSTKKTSEHYGPAYSSSEGAVVAVAAAVEVVVAEAAAVEAALEVVVEAAVASGAVPASEAA